jgi:ligand-binding sensor domain-containing protein
MYQLNFSCQPKKFLRKWAFFILNLPFLILSAQSYYFRNYSVDNGLPFIQVSTIYQDSKGNLWTGGYGGLSKFNGRSFTNYSPKNGLIHHSVTSITEDKQGNLWIGTIDGVNKLSGDKFSSYTVSQGLSDNFIRASITDHEGNVWFATANGITKYTGEKFEIIDSRTGLISNDVLSLYQDAAQVLWIGTSRGLCSYSNKQFTNYTTENGLPDNFIRTICSDASGNLWIGTKNGLSVLKNNKFQNYFTQQGLPDNEIIAVCADAKGCAWVGTNKGLCKFIGSTGGAYFKKYSPGTEFKSNIIESLYTDYEGNFWIGTYNGLYRYRGEVFGLFAEKEGVQNTFIYQILRDKNKNLFVGTSGGGFYIYDGKTFLNYTTKNGLSGNVVNAAVLDKNNDLWIGTNNGLSKFDGHTFVNYNKKDGLHSDSVFAICIDDAGLMWLGQNKGVTRFNGKQFSYTPLKSTSKNFDVWSIMQDKNKTIWIGTYLGGLFKYDANNFTECSNQIGVMSNSVFSILQNTEGDLFFGTLDGVYMYEAGQNKQAVHFGETDGMSSDLVYVTLLDDNGFLWAGTNQGINKINVNEFKKSGKKIIQPYAKEEGFQGVECNTNGAFKETDGSLWFGTVNGLIKYSPAEDILNTIEPKTSIISIALAEHDTLLNNNCSIPYDLNTVSFEFIGVCLTNPAKVRYQYMLDGIDKKWSPPTSENSIKYSSLPPGNYTFKVKSSNNEGVLNKQPAQFSFTIIPPFWKTWWFRVLSIVGIVACIFLFIYYRVEQVRTQERQRSELQKRIANVELLALRSQMNPHFIFNTMTSIQHYIGNNEPDAALKYLSRFAKLMRAIMENTKQPSITIKDELDTLKLYLELEAMRFNNKFEYNFVVEPTIDANYDEIPSMLIQPYIENAIVHGLLPKAENGKLLIYLTKNDNFIVCTIEDNGIGRERARELNKNRINRHKSMGMSITKERLSILNHMNNNNNSVSEEVTDLFDETGNAAGTRVVIRVPLESS